MVWRIMLTYTQLVTEIRQLSTSERKRLIGAIVDSLTEASPPKDLNILDFEGIGRNLHDGTDAQDYVNQLRHEWDERS